MLEFKQVSKSFRDGNQIIQAVKPTDLKIIQGELIAIVGPSGSGKSTFLTMAGALQRPTSGNIYINNKNISILSEKHLSKIRINEIGFILQSTNLVPFLTIDGYQKLVKQLNLSDITNQLPNQISGGQKQRVAIAKAIYTNPSIILADEPTASLDTNNAMAVMKILQEQTKERNKTCVIVTHDERLTHFCDKTYFMEDGLLSLQ